MLCARHDLVPLACLSSPVCSPAPNRTWPSWKCTPLVSMTTCDTSLSRLRPPSRRVDTMRAWKGALELKLGQRGRGGGGKGAMGRGARERGNVGQEGRRRWCPCSKWILETMRA